MSTGISVSETAEVVVNRKVEKPPKFTDGPANTNVDAIVKHTLIEKKGHNDLNKNAVGKDNMSMSQSRQVTVFQVLAKMVGELSGKNSIGKLLQYLFKFILQYSSDSQERFNRLMAKKANVSLDNIYYLASTNPLLGFRYLKYLFLKKHIDRFAGVADGLSLFRQSLRFGKTPFRIVSLKKQFFDILKLRNYQQLIKDNFVISFIDTSYGIVDEIGLLFKLKYFNAEKHPKFKSIIGELDALIWFFDILYQLKTGYQEYNKVQQMLKQTKVEDNDLDSLRKYLSEIEELEFRLKSTKLGLFKAVCDFGFDFIDLFHMHWFFSKYLYYGFGFGSGFFNTWRTYISAKRVLNESKKNS